MDVRPLEGGSYLHQSTVTGVSTEIGPATLYADANASFAGDNSGVSIVNSDLGVDSSLTGGLAIDVESTSFTLRLDDDRFRDGATSENITFKGFIATIDHSWTGATAIINGSGVMDVQRTEFAGGTPTVTNGGTFCGELNTGPSVAFQNAINNCSSQNLSINLSDSSEVDINPAFGQSPDFLFNHSAIAGHPVFEAEGGEIDVYSSYGGSLLGQIDKNGRINSNVVQTTINGTSGTAACSEAMAGSSLKVVNCLLTGYQETSTAQTVCFNGSGCTANLSGVTFSAAPNLLASCGTYEPSSTASTLTLPANASMTAETCNITAIGQ